MTTYQVKIERGRYEGHYRVGEFEGAWLTNLIREDFCADLQPGRYHIDTGSNLGGGYLHFVLTEAGRIVRITPRSAVRLVGRTLRFRTALVAIDPRESTGKWEGSWRARGEAYKGPDGVVRLHLIKGIAVRLEFLARQGTGKSGDDSTLDFRVNADGSIRSLSPQAASGGRVLRFKTRKLFLDPSAAAGKTLHLDGHGKIKVNGEAVHLVRTVKYGFWRTDPGDKFYVNLY